MISRLLRQPAVLNVFHEAERTRSDTLHTLVLQRYY